MPRPKLNINETEVEKLSSYCCTNIEIASFFDCDESTIRKRFSDILTKGRDKGKIKLRKLQWSSAEKGNITMLIWLGKQILGQKEKQDIRLNEELPKGFDLEEI